MTAEFWHEVFADANAMSRMHFLSVYVNHPKVAASFSPQGQMKWVRASERLPELEKDVHAKLEGVPVFGNFYELLGKKRFSINNKNALDSQYVSEEHFHLIEWLDESESPSPLREALEKIANYRNPLMSGSDCYEEIYNIARTALDSLPGDGGDGWQSLSERWSAWSLKTFENATAISSLAKLGKESEELGNCIAAGTKEEQVEEYADCLLCLIDSYARAGFVPEEILQAMSKKIEKNMQRKWKMNDDNTYSHIK